jgi:hypothetical protein
VSVVPPPVRYGIKGGRFKAPHEPLQVRLVQKLAEGEEPGFMSGAEPRARRGRPYARPTTEMPSTIRKVATAMTSIASCASIVLGPKQPRARAL